MRRHAPMLLAALLALLPAGGAAPAAAQADAPADSAASPRRSGALPLEPARTVELTLSEGSWMSVDVSPDGETVVFDLLGDLYTVPIAGGEAAPLTRGMGYDVQPRFSPDGRRIVYVSDRGGAQNVWIVPADGGEARQLTRGSDDLYVSPEWTPDGQYVVVSRARGPMGNAAKLWLYHVDGGSGAQLIDGPDDLKTLGAAFGADDRAIWFAQRTGDWQYDAAFPIYQLAVYDRRTGERTVMSDRYGSAFRPTLSPDGRWLAYGTRHDARTGLRVRELATGQERWLAFPVQRDDKESRSALDVLPGMTFTPDSRELVTTYGGRIWRVPVDGAEPTEVPFTAHASLELGPEIAFDYEVDSGPEFDARQIRDAALSPDGRTLAFTALNRLYVMPYPDGTPRRLTTDDVGEHAPAWAPDGRSLAYITWDDDEGGQVRRIGVDGRGARTLTRTAALYRELAWAPDGERLVAVRAAARDPLGGGGRGADFVAIPAAGGETSLIAPTAGRRAPHFTADPDRIYAYSARDGLVSFRWDGTDVRAHLKVTGASNPRTRRPAQASVILMAPHGDQALAQVVNDLYLVTVPRTGGDAPTISVADPDRAAFPARRLTDVGGHFPGWRADGRALHWSLGSAHFLYDLDAAEDLEAGSEDERGLAGSPAPDSAEDAGYRPLERRVRVAIERDVPEGVVALRGARVITMRGDEILDRADIVVDGARIAAIGPAGTVAIPADVREVDLTGATVVPGFIDIHYHPQSLVTGIHTPQVWQYLATLAWGVTTTRDPQTGSTDVLTYGDRVESGEILGPRIYSTGPGLGISEPVRDADHARDILRRYSEYYDTKTLKMYMAGNRRQRQLIAMAARELEIMPTTEGGMDLALNLTHAIDGYSGIEHNLPITPLYDDVASLLARSGTVNTPTLLVSYGGPLAMNRFFTGRNLHDDPKIRRFHPHEALDRRTRRRGMGGTGSYGPIGWFAPDEYIDQDIAAFLARVVEAGGRIAVGGHGEFHGPGYHWELEILASGGLALHEVLRAATLRGAQAIGLAGDLGSLEPGKLADLVVLDGDPLADIRNTAAIRYVMKNGRLYDGETLDELWPRERPLPALPWAEPEPAPAAGIR